jgi:SAM-dependent methyltransferase
MSFVTQRARRIASRHGIQAPWRAMTGVKSRSWRTVLAGTLRRSKLPLPHALARRLGWRLPGAPLGSIRMGDLRSLQPVSREYGFDRGQPIDRYYIDRFLAAHASLVQGRTLEVGDNAYTLRFGGGRVTRSDVLNVNAGVPNTTFVADLATGAGIPDAAFDCVIVTQTLHLVFDVAAALRTLHRILKPGGTLLLTVPGTISQIEQGEWRSTWYWGFTSLSLGRLFAAEFPASSIEFAEFGNVLASVAFLEGLVAEEFSRSELEHRDALYPLLLAVRATRAP